MFYLDTPVENWLNRYPALKNDEPLCDCSNPNVVSFRSKKSVGIVCRECNSATWIRSSFSGNQELLSLLIG